MNRLAVNPFGLAIGVTSVIMYVIGLILMQILGQESTVYVFNSMMQGIDTTSIVRMDMPVGQIIFGLISTFLVGWITGSIIAALYNSFCSKEQQH